MSRILKLLSAIQSEDIEKINSLFIPSFFKKPIDVNETLEDGKSVLMVASAKSNPDIVKLLLREGANVDAQDEDNKTALMVAVENGNIETVKLLIDSGANVNITSKNVRIKYTYKSVSSGNQTYNVPIEEKILIEDKTALMLAIEHGSELMVNYILDKKPDLEWMNRYGETALLKAAKKHKILLVQILINAGAKTNLLQLIRNLTDSESMILKFIKLFHDSGVDINERGSNGETALMIASYNQSLSVVQFLVENGADINLKDNNGESVLFYMLKYGFSDDLNILEYLCQKGLDVNVKNKNDKFPSIQSNNTLCAFTKVLIQAGIQYIPGDSRTLMMKAIENNDCAVVDFLIRNGAELGWEETMQDEDEWGRYTVSKRVDMYNFAKEKGALEVCNLISAHYKNLYKSTH